MEMAEPQFDVDFDLDINMDTLCDKLKRLREKDLSKYQEKIQKYYKKSNSKDKMFILLSTLVNNYLQTHKKIITNDSKLEECNLIHCNTEDINYVIRELFTDQGQLKTNQLFIYMMVHKKHWITIFVEILSFLIVHKEQELVELISHHRCVSFVWPAVLSALWEQHSTHPNIFQLSLDTLQRCANSGTSLFSQIEVALNRADKFVKWLQSMETFQRNAVRSDQVLQMFSKHSVLYLVNEYLHLHTDNICQLRQYIVENAGSKSWQVSLFDAYSILYHTTLLLIASPQLTQEAFARQLRDILVLYPLPHRSKLEISESLLSLLFLKQNDLKQNPEDMSKTDKSTKLVTKKIEETEECLEDYSGASTSPEISDVHFVVNNVDKLEILTSTLQTYMTNDGSSSDIQLESRGLLNDLDEIRWKTSTIQHLIAKHQDTLNLGDHLFGRSRSDVYVSSEETCPVRLLLSAAPDFAIYCIIKDDLPRAVETVQRYNLESTEEGRQIFAMQQYASMVKMIASAPPHDTHQVALQEVDKFLALCGPRRGGTSDEVEPSAKLTILTDILSSVAMLPSQSKKLLAVIINAAQTCEADLPNFSSLLAHLKRAQKGLTQCIRDNLILPSTTLVEFIASGYSHTNLLFWRSLEAILKEFSAAESKRLEEYFVMLVNVIKQSPYLDLEMSETEETKPFSSRIQKMFLYLSFIDSMMTDHKGNLLSCVDHNLTDQIGESLFVRHEPIASLDLPFVNLAYHAVNYCTGSIPLSRPHECLSELIVLNQCDEPQTVSPYTLSADDTLRDLLSSLLSHCNCDDVIDLASATRTQSVVMETRQLSRVDLSRYMRGEDSTVFLINLYNLMWVHALLTLEMSGKRTGLVSQSATCRFLTKRLVAYHLGQAGPVTLHHIEALLLHNFPHVFGALVDPDLSAALCPSEPLSNPLAGWNTARDPRTVFALGNPYLLSPLIRVLSPADNLDLTLEHCMSQYAAQHIALSQNCLHIPQLVFHYLDYVTSIARPECEHSNSSDTSSNQSRETRVALIEFVKEYTPVRSFILSRKDVHVLDEVRFSIRQSYGDPSNPSVTSSAASEVTRIDSHIVDCVADNDPMLGGILATLAKANSVPATPSKSGKDKRSAQSPPADSSQHKTSSKISERLQQLCSNSRRVQLLSLLTPGKDPLLCFLSWNVNLEAVWATIEQEMSRGNFVLVLEILYYVLTPRVFMEDVRLRQLYDTVLLELASTCDSYILDVTSLPTMADHILNNQNACSLKCLQYLAARHEEIDPDRAAKVDRQFFLTKLNHDITETCGLSEWSITEDSDPYEILKQIILREDGDLAQRWCVYKSLPCDGVPDLEVLELYVVFLLSTQRAGLAEDLCNALSSSQLRELCTRLISSSCDVTHVKVVVNQALSRCEDQSGHDYESLVCTVIGVDMLSLMNCEDQKLYRHLIGSPYLIIEQLILLTRLSLLEKILAHIKPHLIPADAIPDKIPPGRLLQSEIDALLRTYATKALDFRICDVTASRTILRRHDKLLSFSPPRAPPSKDAWVPNDECMECMVCRVTIFSMFNRRHHCRRCGRLVCGGCSENRMKVSGYGGVAVRVCTQCHAYSSPRSLQLEVTCLSPTNENTEQSLVFRNSHAHNETLREEFSYEYAPSVSLCLSILRFHSQNTTLAMYLCETCTGLLHVMKPSSREIDYSFVLRMIKCLVLACKLIYDLHGVESGTLDEIIARANLLSILVNHNCCHLVPEKPLVGQTALRQLRDSLLREERWSLALEVSTKAGLDYNSVWTVWGKACLRAGAWPEARSIFAKCHFDRRENSTLIDILQILQNDMHNGGDLSSRLSKLKSPTLSPATEGAATASYAECLYYLHTYGSDGLILTFYVQRESLREALAHARDTRVSPELFVEHVFLRCVKLGMTEQLYTLMEETDPSLLAWRHHLRAACAHCERHSLLHCLYAIQLRTRDPARAAITCVLFYLRDAQSYAQLNEKAYQLARARGHLNDYRAQKTKLENHLCMHISPGELNKQLVLLEYQTKLVATLVSTGEELAHRCSDKVATLFGGMEEKAQVLADVLGLESGGGSGEGRFRSLCKETVTALGLNPLLIYSELFRLLARQGRIQDIKHLVAALRQSLGASCDDVLVAAVRQKPPQVEQLISLVSKIPLQISLFTEAGKLKSAYLLSVKHNRLGDIRLIAARARALNQAAILNICLKKLALEDAKESGALSKESGALSKESGALSKELGGLAKESGSVSKESGALSKELGGLAKESGNLTITSQRETSEDSSNSSQPTRDTDSFSSISRLSSDSIVSNRSSISSPLPAGIGSGGIHSRSTDQRLTLSSADDGRSTSNSSRPDSDSSSSADVRPSQNSNKLYAKNVRTSDIKGLSSSSASVPIIESRNAAPSTSTMQNTQGRVISKKVRIVSPVDKSSESDSKTLSKQTPSSIDDSFDSIKSVLKMYEQNVMKDGQPGKVISKGVSEPSVEKDLKSQRSSSRSAVKTPDMGSPSIVERVKTPKGSPRGKSSITRGPKSKAMPDSELSAGTSSRYSLLSTSSKLSPSSRLLDTTRPPSGISPPSLRSDTPGTSGGTSRRNYPAGQTGVGSSPHRAEGIRNTPPSSRSSPEDSIASVLRRYELNRLRESQIESSQRQASSSKGSSHLQKPR